MEVSGAGEVLVLYSTSMNLILSKPFRPITEPGLSPEHCHAQYKTKSILKDTLKSSQCIRTICTFFP